MLRKKLVSFHSLSDWNKNYKSLQFSTNENYIQFIRRRGNLFIISIILFLNFSFEFAIDIHEKYQKLIKLK
jgi:hypothetical protein